MDLFVTCLATDGDPLEGHLPSILFSNVAPPSSTAAQRNEQDQEDPTDRRSDSDEDRLMLIDPTAETVAGVGLPDLRWAGGSKVIEEGLATGGVDTLQSDLDKVVVSLNQFCGGEELDVWVGDFVLLAVHEVAKIDEHISVSD